MHPRLLKTTVSLVTLAAALNACSSDTPSPVGVQSVRLAVVANAANGGKPFALDMATEYTNEPQYAGDQDGTGSALLTVNHGQQTVCWELKVANIALPATAAHIHHAAEGVRGPVAIGLSAPDASGLATGCAENLSRDLLRDILENPADYYVNVHTSQFPAGAIRAQMHH